LQWYAKRTTQKKTKEIIDTSIISLTNFKHKIDAILNYFKENADVVAKLTTKNGPLGSILQTIEGISEASGNARGARMMKNLEIDPEDKEVRPYRPSATRVKDDLNRNI
jgi:hypothetical protein